MKKFIYFLMIALCGATFTSCESEDGPDEPISVDPVYVSTGLLVLNEGNYYSSINGSLSYIDYHSSTILEDIFKDANQRSLGGTPNDMVQVDSRLFICVTDENRLEIVETQNAKSVRYAEITQPREVCASGDGVYVSSYDGTVTMFDFEGKKLAKSEKVGACLEGITVRDGYVYVCNAYNADYTYNTNVVKLEEGSLKKVKDITVACNPTQLEFDGGDIYVLSTGNYGDVQAQIQTIDKDDNVKYLCDATMMAIDKNTVYAINAVYGGTPEYFKIEGSTGVKTPILASTATADIYSPCSIAVDPMSQYIFVGSYNLGAYGYADYSAPGFVMQFKYDGNFVKKYDAGVGPTTMAPLITEQYIK